MNKMLLIAAACMMAVGCETRERFTVNDLKTPVNYDVSATAAARASKLPGLRPGFTIDEFLHERQGNVGTKDREVTIIAWSRRDLNDESTPPLRDGSGTELLAFWEAHPAAAGRFKGLCAPNSKVISSEGVELGYLALSDGSRIGARARGCNWAIMVRSTLGRVP